MPFHGEVAQCGCMPRQRRASGGRRVPAAKAASRRGRARPSGIEQDLTREFIVWLVALKIAGIVLIFDPGTLQVFDLTKSIFSRATAWILAALVILLLVRYGAAAIPRVPVLAFASIYLVTNVVSAIFAADQYVALFGESFRYLGLTFLGDMAVLALAAAVAFRGPRDWAILGGVLGVATLAVSGYVALQFLGLDPLPWSQDLRARPFGTLGNPDITGHVLSTAFAAAVGVAALANDRRARVAAAGVAVATVAASGLVATRGSLLGIGAGLLGLGIVVVGVRGLRRRTIAIGAAVIAVALVALALPTPLGTRVAATLQGSEIRDRIAIYEGAIGAIAARPIIGFGVDGFGVAYPAVRTADSATFGADRWTSSAHNWILQVAATTGIVGLATFVALLGAAASALWRGLAGLPVVAGAMLLSLSAYLAQGLVTVGSISIDWLPWLAVGAASALSRPGLSTGVARPMPNLAQVAVLAVAILVALSGLNANDANHSAKDAYVGKDRVGAALRTVRLDAGRALHWRLLGLAYADRQQWREAADAHAVSVRLAPYRSDAWISLARARAELALKGEPTAREASLSAAREGARQDPHEPSARIGLAEVALDLGEYDLALSEAVAAIKLLPADPHYDDVAAAAAVRAVDRAAARRSLEDALALKDSGTLRTALSRLSSGQ